MIMKTVAVSSIRQDMAIEHLWEHFEGKIWDKISVEIRCLEDLPRFVLLKESLNISYKEFYGNC